MFGHLSPYVFPHSSCLGLVLGKCPKLKLLDPLVCGPGSGYLVLGSPFQAQKTAPPAGRLWCRSRPALGVRGSLPKLRGLIEVRMSMIARMFSFMYVYVYKNMYMYIYIYTHVPACLHTYTYTYTYTYNPPTWSQNPNMSYFGRKF